MLENASKFYCFKPGQLSEQWASAAMIIFWPFIRPIQIVDVRVRLLLRLIRRDYRLWNHGGDPFANWAACVTGILALLGIYVIFGCGFPEDWRIPPSLPICSVPSWAALIICYVGVALVFGSLVTLLFTELNRKILRRLGLTHPPNTPRLRSVYTGNVERLLFTTLGIVLIFRPDGSDGSSDRDVAGLALIGAYLAFKQFYSEKRGGERVRQSIHAIWGSGLSVGIAMLASWWFWQLAPPAS